MPIHKLKKGEYPDVIIIFKEDGGVEKIYTTVTPKIKIALVDSNGKVEIRTEDEAFVKLSKVSNYEG